MTEAGEAPVHYGSAEAFAWQAGYEAGVAEGIRQAREAVAADAALIEKFGGGVVRTWTQQGVTFGPMPEAVADAIVRIVQNSAPESS